MNLNKPKLIDAVIGNSSMLASLGRTGVLYRLWWPHVDTPQHIDAMRVAVQFGDAKPSWLDSENNGWIHQISYVERSNAVQIAAVSSREPLSVNSLQFVMPNDNVLVRHYTFTNTGVEPISFSLIAHSAMTVSESERYNTTMFNEENDALIHFHGKHFFSWSSANVCTAFQSGISYADVQLTNLHGNIIDMRGDGAMAWQINDLQPGEQIAIPIYVAAGLSEKESLNLIRMAKSKPAEAWADECHAYWDSYLTAAKPCPLDEQQYINLYNRSLLVFKLMSDHQTGSIIAAPEFDEWFIQCGGYAYCWGRDAAFITTALDEAGLYDLSSRFYEWTLTAQSLDGSWQQRHYHDGTVAPSWGLQIDEGASILWGMWQHYLTKQDKEFVGLVWPAVCKGAEFLLSYLDEETGIPKPSMDLWEEREGSHLYSTAAVYGGLIASANFAELIGEQEFATRWQAVASLIAESTEELYWNKENDSYYRSLDLTVSKGHFAEALALGKTGYTVPLAKGYVRHVLNRDDILDISLLGASVPFGLVNADSERMKLTADAVEKALTASEVGGIKRYTNDHYIGGNPWILTTLWLAHYRIATDDLESGRRLLNWVVEHQTEVGLLPEQIDKETGKPAWVIPLTWSHAMYVLALFMLAKKESEIQQ